ncbi:gcvH [Symbiodinium sp. KB8]|nr:gcvH [Symbiodinium sp. KB8]
MIRAAINRPAALWRRTMSNRAFITYYTKEHEYLSVDGNIGTLGITTYAAEELGRFIVLFGQHAASDIYSPVDGKVVEVNSVLSDKPGLVNEDPESAGWFAKLELSDPDQVNDLMTEEQYKEHVEALKQ